MGAYTRSRACGASLGERGKSWGRTNSLGRTVRLIGAHESVLRICLGLLPKSKYLLIPHYRARYIAVVYIAVAYPPYLGLIYITIALLPQRSALYYWLNLFKNAALIIIYSCDSRLLISMAAIRLFLDRFLIGAVLALASTSIVGPFTRRG